jgi:hypothetical protein
VRIIKKKFIEQKAALFMVIEPRQYAATFAIVGLVAATQRGGWSICGFDPLGWQGPVA